MGFVSPSITSARVSDIHRAHNGIDGETRDNRNVFLDGHAFVS